VRNYHRHHDSVSSIFIPLAAVRDPEQVLPAIARLIDPDGPETDPVSVITQAVRHRDVILLLDNADLVTRSGPALANLLMRPECERVTLLATSRGPFNLPGEHLLTLSPLPLIAASEQRADIIRSNDAVKLFLARARAARANLRFTDQELSDVAAICRRLDGLPLAIELTASRLRLLTLPAVAAKLEQSRFSLDPPATAGARSSHPALRKTISLSYELLSPEQQRLFRRLSVFVGGITIESARGMAAGRTAETGYPFAHGYGIPFPFSGYIEDPGINEAPEIRHRLPLPALTIDAPSTLEYLADRSLLQRVTGVGGELRYEFLETIREFALEQLAEEDDPEAVHHLHAAIMLALAEASSEGTWVPARRVLGIEHIDAELANMRAALDWLIGAGREAADLALRLIDVLNVFWQMRGMAAEGRLWLGRILALEGGSNYRRANALNSLGYLNWLLGNTGQSEDTLQQALALLTGTPYASPRGRTCFFLALVAWRKGSEHGPEALGYLLEALASFALWDDVIGQGVCKLALGELARLSEQFPESLRLFAEANALHESIGYEWGMATAQWFTGEAQRKAGHDRESAASFARALQVYTAFGDRLGASGCLGGIACLLAARQEWTAAGRLLGAAATLKERTQSFLPPTHEAEYGAIARSVLLAAGAEPFEAGQQLDQAQAIEEALDLANAIARDIPVSSTADERGKPLTRIQKQVLSLLAEGHEPKSISTALGKSRSTIYGHLDNLRAHFDCNTYDELRQQARALGLPNDTNEPPVPP
jgi:non-specific serine/threonine protein kinase